MIATAKRIANNDEAEAQRELQTAESRVKAAEAKLAEARREHAGKMAIALNCRYTREQKVREVARAKMLAALKPLDMRLAKLTDEFQAAQRSRNFDKVEQLQNEIYRVREQRRQVAVA